ncbi:MAG: 50S ribosomal protein L14e [Sulfolobales archaeon]
MPAIEVGRICVKLRGREAGRKCVIVDIIDNNYVLITGPKELTGVKRRRVNIGHVEPLDKKVEISKGASDEEVMRSLEASNLVDFMKARLKVSREMLLKVKALREGAS